METWHWVRFRDRSKCIFSIIHELPRLWAIRCGKYDLRIGYWEVLPQFVDGKIRHAIHHLVEHHSSAGVGRVTQDDTRTLKRGDGIHGSDIGQSDIGHGHQRLRGARAVHEGIQEAAPRTSPVISRLILRKYGRKCIYTRHKTHDISTPSEYEASKSQINRRKVRKHKQIHFIHVMCTTNHHIH